VCTWALKHTASSSIRLIFQTARKTISVRSTFAAIGSFVLAGLNCKAHTTLPPYHKIISNNLTPEKKSLQPSPLRPSTNLATSRNHVIRLSANSKLTSCIQTVSKTDSLQGWLTVLAAYQYIRYCEKLRRRTNLLHQTTIVYFPLKKFNIGHYGAKQLQRFTPSNSCYYPSHD